MISIFIYYVIGFGIFLVITYLSAQLGWLFQDGGKINMAGVLGLSGVLVTIFLFVTFVGALQLSGWTPHMRNVQIPAKLQTTKVKDAFGKARDKLAQTAEDTAESMDAVWEDGGHVGIQLPKTQGATTMQMLIHDLSTTHFLNRMNPMKFIKKKEQETDTDAAASESAPPATKPETPPPAFDQAKQEQEVFRTRIEAVESHFKMDLRIPETVLPEEMRRVEEIYLAITKGKVSYPYVRFEFSLPLKQALAFAEKYERQKDRKPLSVKVPSHIEVFGEQFDLGICLLTFPGARLEPSLEKIKELENAEAVKFRIVPLKRPASISAVYEKFLSGKESKSEG